MKLLGIGAIAVLAIVMGSAVLPVLADQWSENRDEGKDLAAATGATMRKADDLGSSFGRLIPARAEAAAEGDGDDLTQAGPESSDASNDPVGSGHDVQHEVAAALEALASVDTGKNDVSANERIVAIENLRDIWSPRYRQAEEEHRRLAYHIEHAQRAAERYFSAQAELTGQIKNPEERLRAEASDRAERKCTADGEPRPTGPWTRPTGSWTTCMTWISGSPSNCSAPTSRRSTTTSWSCPLPSATCIGICRSSAPTQKRSVPPSPGIDPTALRHTNQKDDRL